MTALPNETRSKALDLPAMQMPGCRYTTLTRAFLASARKALSLNLRARTSAARADRSRSLPGMDVECLP